MSEKTKALPYRAFLISVSSEGAFQDQGPIDYEVRAGGNEGISPAGSETVPASGRILFHPPEHSLSGKECGIMAVAGLNNGGDAASIVADITGFLSAHDANIVSGYQTTMLDNIHGAHYVFTTTPDKMRAIKKDYSESFGSLSPEIGPYSQPVREGKDIGGAAPTTPGQDVQHHEKSGDFIACEVVVIVRDGPDVWHRFAEIVMGYPVRMRSQVGGPFEPQAKQPGDPEDLAAIKAQVQIAAYHADEIIRQLEYALRQEKGWYVRIRVQGSNAPIPGWQRATPPITPDQPKQSRSDRRTRRKEPQTPATACAASRDVR